MQNLNQSSTPTRLLLVVSAFIWLCAANAVTPPNFLWAKKGGGSGFDFVYGVSVDARNNCFITGYFQSTAFFGSTNVSSVGGFDIFLAKYDSAGDLQWLQRAGGASFDYASAIAVDGAGNSYIAGTFGSTATFGSTTLTNDGRGDLFLAKFSTTGVLQWVQKVGGTGDCWGLSVALDMDGNAYVTGYIDGSVSFGGTTVTNISGGQDIFISKYSNAGAFQWVQIAGGPTNDIGYAVAVDSQGDAYLTGIFGGTASFGNTNLVGLGSRNVFIAKYGASGNSIWAVNIGRETTQFNDLAIDSANSLYVTGDGFLAKFDATGTQEWLQPIVGSGNRVVVDILRDVYVTGDNRISKYSAHEVPIWNRTIPGKTFGIALDAGGYVSLSGTFTGTANFGVANLSDSGNGDIYLAKLNITGTSFTISRGPGEVVLSWPIFPPDFLLESNTNLALNTWTAVPTNGLIVMGLTNFLTQPTSARSQFFRLRHP